MKPFIALIFAALCVLGGHASAANAKKPNVLVILADDLGYGETACQGFAKDIPTPHIDSIAQNGVRFTSGYVSGAYCSPTRAGLMTGRYQNRFGHEFNGGNPRIKQHVTQGLALTESTVADRLKPAGYATCWIGKSHLGFAPPFHPFRRGFDEFFGMLGAGHDYLDAKAEPTNPILRGNTPIEHIDYLTETLSNEAAAFIERRKGGPWFCYLAFNAVHTPLETIDKYERRFASIADPTRRTYAAMQSALDDAVGAVLARIRGLGLEEDTLIFFLSDNGGPTSLTTSSNGPLRGFKAQLWEGGIRVPFMAQWKGRIPAGQVDNRPVIQLDILPTALAAAGVDIQPEWKLDGVNLLPFLTGKSSAAPHKALYWRFGQQTAIRMGDWKLVKGIGVPGAQGYPRNRKASMDGAELYNLAADIGETKNLASAEPQRVKQLVAAWNRWNAENVDPAWYAELPGAAKKNAAKKKAGK